MGYDAIQVGAYDLYAGIDLLKQEAAKHKLTLISANILKDGRPVFTPWTIVEKNGIKIGITGITRHKLPADLVKKGYAIEDQLMSIKRVLPYMEGKADIIILLSNTGHNYDVSLLKAIPEVKIIVGSGPGSSFKAPFKTEDGFILRSTPKGKAIGKAEITLVPNTKNDVNVSGTLIVLNRNFPKDSTISKEEQEFKTAPPKKSAPGTIKSLFGTSAPVKSGKVIKNDDKSTPAVNPFLEAIKNAIRKKQEEEAARKKAQAGSNQAE
jgi:2',3'-cyclic-nucleotide 2'-phosphodiesterase (5'-nucleotidase family)